MSIVYENEDNGMFAFAGRVAVEQMENGVLILHVAGLQIYVHKIPEGSMEIMPTCVVCDLPVIQRRNGAVAGELVHMLGNGQQYAACPDRHKGRRATAQPLAGLVMITTPHEGTDPERLREIDAGRHVVIPRTLRAV